jgi:DNA-binding HxlR family transcriptional regulator
MRKEKKIGHRDVQDALELIGGRWRGAIMASLCDKPKRFSQLKADLSPITARILIKELRYLEDNLMIVAEKNTAAQNSVLYSHSEHGSTLAPVIFAIQNWSAKHRELMLKKLAE